MNNTIRVEAQRKRNALSAEEIYSKSISIVDTLIPYLNNKKLIGIYMPHNNEADITSLMFMFNPLGIPKIRNNEEMDFYLIHSPMEVSKGTFNVLEPTSNIWIDPKDFDAIIVPIVAFNTDKYRLGHGRGYYDRYLANTNALKIGVAFDFQCDNRIEVFEHDVKLDLIITETKVYE